MSHTTSLGSWNSKTVRRVDVLAVCVAVCIVCRLAWQEDLTWIGAVAVCGLVVVLTAVRWPYGALIVLIGTGAMPVFFVEISSWRARPEHFGAAIVFVAVLIWMLTSKIEESATRQIGLLDIGIRSCELRKFDVCVLCSCVDGSVGFAKQLGDFKLFPDSKYGQRFQDALTPLPFC